MNYLLIAIVFVSCMIVLVYRIVQLTEMLQDGNVIIEEREIKINSDTNKINYLRGKLDEVNDKIESLQVVNDQQALTIKDFQIVTGSAYVNTAKKVYPNAPAETIKKAVIRDAKGHFVKH